MFTQEQLHDALAACYVPALRRDVVAAGLVQSATLVLDDQAPGSGIAGVPARYLARIVLRAPGGDEGANAGLQAVIENRLLGLPEISRAEVTILPALFPILHSS